MGYDNGVLIIRDHLVFDPGLLKDNKNTRCFMRIEAKNIHPRNLTKKLVALATNTLDKKVKFYKDSIRIQHFNEGTNSYLFDVLASSVVEKRRATPKFLMQCSELSPIVENGQKVSLYEDKEGEVWKRIGDMVIRNNIVETKEDFDLIMASAENYNSSINPFAKNLTNIQKTRKQKTLECTDFVYYYSLEKDQCDFGAVSATHEDKDKCSLSSDSYFMITPFTNNKPTTELVNGLSIIDFEKTDDLPESNLSIADDAVTEDPTTVMSFYARLYSQYPEYWEEMKRIINERAV